MLDDLYDSLGVRMGVDSAYFLPSLWQLYESDCPGYFFFKCLLCQRAQHNCSAKPKTCLSNIILYRINAKGKQTDYELHLNHERDRQGEEPGRVQHFTCRCLTKTSSIVSSTSSDYGDTPIGSYRHPPKHPLQRIPTRSNRR